MAHQSLAGTLEKRSRWRKEWEPRFFVMDQDRINYFLKPPAILEDISNHDELRGSIPLAGQAALAEEDVGRPHCIRIGRDLLSCKTRAEQLRWLTSINEAIRRASAEGLKAVELKAPGPARSFCKANSQDQEEKALLLLLPDKPQQAVVWHQPLAMEFADQQTCASILILDNSSRSGGSGSVCDETSAQALCRLLLFDVNAGERPSFPVQNLRGSSTAGDGWMGEQWSLQVHVHSVEVVSQAISSSKFALAAMLGAALSLILAGSMASGACLFVMGLLVLAWDRQMPSPARRRVTFSVERLGEDTANRAESRADTTSAAANFSDQAASDQPATAEEEAEPLWCGKWTLDKRCSEKYEPILKDMGVNYLVRKAADAKTSVLIIGKSSSNVTFVVKTLVTVEDVLPLDGSWIKKPVPPAGRMRGEMRLRLTKHTQREMEMLTEFPVGEGNLRDTLVVHEDGASFTRTVVRGRSDGGQLVCTRVFRKN